MEPTTVSEPTQNSSDAVTKPSDTVEWPLVPASLVASLSGFKAKAYFRGQPGTPPRVERLSP